MKTADKLSKIMADTDDSIKIIVKIALQSKRCVISFQNRDANRRLIILANGPSLRETMAEHTELLKENVTMAVNFAANTDMFKLIKPRFYVLADPHFFRSDEPNVIQLWENLNLADWSMTVYVPAAYAKRARALAPSATIEAYNAVGVEGWRWLCNAAYDSGLGMPRPRNVLIPAIMIAIQAGFKEIFLTGADHSWLQTLSVGDDNAVLSIQPHFYADNKRELSRSAAEYRGYRLHDVLRGFTIAFESYHRIRQFADTKGVNIYNATPGSYIDAFQRKSL